MYNLEILQKIKDSSDLQDAEWETCKRDRYHWLTHWVQTLDAHNLKEPIQYFPDKEYLKITTDLWINNLLLNDSYPLL